MKLSADELKLINDHMAAYKIKYRDVHNEVLDHVVSAIQEKREAGDHSNIELLFMQIIEEHFGGTEGIEKLVAEHGKAYTRSINKLWMQSLKHYLTLPMLGFAIVALLLSIKLPDTNMVKTLILVMCTVLVCSPIVYAHFLLKGRVVKVVNGNQRFLRIHLVIKTGTPAIFLYLPFRYIPHQYIYQLPPIVFMSIMIVFVLLNLAAINFCRQFTALTPVTR
ncbi:hypothetical protein AAFN85_11260 [Mucilaginibacter sp. CAU 1740]|uniref:hypothetical protein n=1 Tax=Mucilaginibacter sp. CAU 1740 TaxID=3140365 RepID=UPI00325AE73E